MSLPLLAPRPEPLLMGVVNVTPDSFSDGGRWLDPAAAVAHGLRLVADGAAIVDVGGESTRPGAERPDEAEELRRVIPVVTELVARGVDVSIDTMRAVVADAAVAAGAGLVNDVSGGLADPDMAAVVAASGTPFVVMHWRGHSAGMQDEVHYDDVVADVRRELGERVESLVAAGVARDRLVLDPGIGFAKHAEHNWRLLAGLSGGDGLDELGLPVLVGTSRKTFLGRVGRDQDDPRPLAERDVATAVTTAALAGTGVWGVRVHDVRASRDALDVIAALTAARPGGAGEAP